MIIHKNCGVQGLSTGGQVRREDSLIIHWMKDYIS